MRLLGSLVAVRALLFTVQTVKILAAIVNVSWTTMGYQHYLAPVMITARDRSGLIRDIATVVSEIGVNMASVSSNVSIGKESAVISATLEIDSLDQMQRVFTRLEKVKGVLHIERDLGKIKKK